MSSIQKVSDDNKKPVISWLKKDVVKNAFALYDLQYDEESTQMYIALGEGESIQGYLLIYKRLKYPSVLLEGNITKLKDLLRKIDLEKMIIHVPPEFLPLVKEEFPSAETCVEDWMLIKSEQLHPIGKVYAKKLRAEDSSKLASLIPGTFQPGGVADYRELIRKFSVYGVFVNDKLVSTARSYIQLPEIWFIGGVYTHPRYRNQGYATQVTYAVTKEGLDNTGLVSLFVRSGNYSALRVYDIIGYKRIDRKVWIDVGTGIKP